MLKMAPEFVDAKVNHLHHFLDKLGEVSTQIKDFKICPQIGY
jgi:hypothetical protein